MQAVHNFYGRVTITTANAGRNLCELKSNYNNRVYAEKTCVSCRINIRTQKMLNRTSVTRRVNASTQ